MRECRCDCGLCRRDGRRGAGGHDIRECRCERWWEGSGGRRRCCWGWGWYDQRLRRRRLRRGGESATVEDPYANKTVRGARAREAHVVEKVDVFRKWVGARQGYDVEFAAPLAAP
jgi:hypothetical protein